MTIADPYTTETFSVEKDWSSVYVDVVRKLRQSNDGVFEKWLRTAARFPELDISTYFRNRRWGKSHHAVALVNAAKNQAQPWATVGLLLAIKTPIYETLRLAFPSSLSDVAEFRTLFTLDNLEPNWFPKQHRLRHQHAQINFSDRFGPKGRKDICSGMLWSSMTSNKPLYCGDVTRLNTDRQETLGGDHGIRPFQSVGTEQEKFLGMSSILYVPIHSGNGGEGADLVLGLYSPVPFVFGTHSDFKNGFLDPKDRYCEAAFPEWLDDFTSRFLLSKVLPTLLINIDRAYRRGMFDLAEIVQLTHTRVDLIMSSLRQKARELQQANGHSTDAVIDALLSAAEHTYINPDPHYRILQLYREALIHHAADSNVEPLTEHDVELVYRYLRTENDRLVSCSADKRVLFFKNTEPDLRTDTDTQNLEQNRIAEAVVSILNGYIKNAQNANSGSIHVGHEVLGDRIVFSVKNSVQYSEHAVRQYWVVRQGHIIKGKKTTQQSGSHGLSLYLTREISRYLNVECEFDMPVPSLSKRQTTWRSTVSAPFKQ